MSEKKNEDGEQNDDGGKPPEDADFVLYKRDDGTHCIGTINTVLENGTLEVVEIDTMERIVVGVDDVTNIPSEVAFILAHHRESTTAVDRHIIRMASDTGEDTDLSDDYIRAKREIDNLKTQLSPRVYDGMKKKKDDKYCCGLCDTVEDNRSKKFRKNIRRVVNLLNISPRKKAIILDRYVSLVEAYSKTKAYYTYSYNGARIITTLCGILTPALVSIQPMFGMDTIHNPVYWSTWCVSLLSGIVSGYIALFKLDRKYYSTIKAYLKLESEGWMYFTLTGKYAIIVEGDNEPTHSNRFTMFCDAVECIRRGEMSVDMSASSSSSTDISSRQKSRTR